MLIANWQLLDVERRAAPEQVRDDWSGLARCALVPAGLNSPEFMIPQFRHLDGAELASVRESGALVLVLPVKRRRFPSAFLTNWVTPFNVSGLPHLDYHHGASALEAFLRREATPVMLTGIPADGPFWDALQGAAHRLAIVDRWERAALRPNGSFETWYEINFERKRRKEYRRLRTRLSEQGRLECLSLKPGDNVAPWITNLLELEAAGWKGRRGTALKSQNSVTMAFTEACRDLHNAGKLRFWSLVLNGRTIATMFAVVEGSGAWLGKIAYDETLAKFSPGVLLILDATEAFFSEAGIACVDSCAIPGHPMIDNIWRGRVAMADVVVASANVGKRKFDLIVHAENFRRKLRTTVRDILYKLVRRHRS